LQGSIQAAEYATSRDFAGRGIPTISICTRAAGATKAALAAGIYTDGCAYAYYSTAQNDINAVLAGSTQTAVSTISAAATSASSSKGSTTYDVVIGDVGPGHGKG